MDFYAALGFTEASVGETWRHPYAVMTDGRLCIGLHQAGMRAGSLTFVKPDLLKHLHRLEALGVDFEFRRLGNDVFNEVGWLDPAGHRIRLMEARTFSPSQRGESEPGLCGFFLEIALPAPVHRAAVDYWEKLGFVCMDEAGALLAHASCTSDGIQLGLYDPGQLRRPALLYDTPDVDETLARLAKRGIFPSDQLPPLLAHVHAAALVAPEGTLLVLSSVY